LEVGAMGPTAVWAVPTLVELLGNPLPQVRVLAANDLGHIGPGANSALPALRDAIQDSNPAVKRAAEEALKRILPQSPGGYIRQSSLFLLLCFGMWRFWCANIA
jgi:HEAT repeat protein